MVIVVVVMGVAGSGKTTVGSALAAARGWRFVDADDVHAPASVAKMARGEALTDADRAPWLARLRAIIVDALAQNSPLVLACSALKAAYREALVDGDGARARVVHLAATPALLRHRLEARPGHYMKATMLDGQLATLEAPGDLLQNPRTGSEPPANHPAQADLRGGPGMRSDEASSSSRDAALTLDASLPVATLVAAIETALGLSA